MFHEYNFKNVTFIFKTKPFNSLSFYDDSGEYIDEISTHDLYDKDYIKKSNKEQKKDGLICFDKFTGGNMCHVVFDHLTRALELNNKSQRKNYFLDNSWPWAKLFIEGVLENFDYLKSNNVYHFSNLTVVKPKGSTKHPNIYYSEKSKDILLKFINEETKKYRNQVTPKKIYLSRKGRGARSIINESDIEALMSSYGYFIYNPTSDNPIEQLVLFSNADEVVSFHGAGLSSLISSPEKTKVIELFSSEFEGTQAYKKLSETLNLEYHSYTVPVANGIADIEYIKPLLSEPNEKENIKILNDYVNRISLEISREKSIHGLPNKFANIFKETAIHFENIDINKSIYFMELAKMIRPDGMSINKKLSEYKNIV